MVPILVFLTFAVFILGSLVLASRRRRMEVAASTLGPAADLFFHRGQTWARRRGPALVEVGATELATNFTGELDAVELPEPGSTLRQGDPVWTMVARNGRRLTQTMPVTGRVVEVNPALVDSPDLTQTSSYTLGWMLRLRPSFLGSGLDDLLHGTKAEEWLDTSRAKVTASLCSAVGAVAHDGGLWVRAFGDQLEDEQWDRLRDELFPSV